MSTYRTTYSADRPTPSTEPGVVRVNRSDLDGIDVRLDVAEGDVLEASVYLDREEAIALGRALIDAAGGIRPLERMGQLRRHDEAINAVRDTVAIAVAEGANAASIIGRVLNGIRNYSLGGHRERAEAYAIAGLIDGEDHGLAEQLEATGTAYIKVERHPGAEATVTVLPTIDVIEHTEEPRA